MELISYFPIHEESLKLELFMQYETKETDYF